MNEEHKGNGQAFPQDAPKDFFNVVEMTKAFREWNDRFDAPREPGEEDLPGDQRETMNAIQVWQARALMACAQQMVQINMSLKKLIIQRERPQLPRPLPKKKSGPKDSLTMD